MADMLINGQRSSTLSAMDRGLMYGDGLFETIKVVRGEPQYWQQHMARLQASAQRLLIEMPDPQLLLDELYSLSRAPVRPQAMPLAAARPQIPLSTQPKTLAKITLTRGVGGRGYFPAKVTATRMVQLFHWPQLPADNALQGIRVRVCELRLAHQPVLAGIKHLNRLENVMARGEWQGPEIAEGLLRDQQGDFIEGTMSNLFIIKQGVLYSDDLQRCGVAGIMRGRIIELAKQHSIPLELTPIKESMLREADELFVCNAIIGIWPIREVLGMATYPVGKITQQIQSLL